MILKVKTFMYEEDLVDFVNQNDIARENIFTITRASNVLDTVKMSIFYYEEGNYVKQKKEVKIEIKEKKDTWF